MVGLDREAPGHHLAIALADHDIDRPAELDLALDRLALARRRRGAAASASTIVAGVSPASSTLTTVEVVGAAGADGDDAADRHGVFRAGRLRGVAGEEDRRPRGIGGRRHPGVDPGDGGGDRLAAAEGFAELLDPLRPGKDEADHEEEDGEEADRPRVAAGEARRGQAGLERVERGEQPLAMGEPERLRGGVAGADGNAYR